MEHIIVMHEKDNIAVALTLLAQGSNVSIRGSSLHLLNEIPFAHKVAICDIPQGERIFKYGEPVGIATQPIAAGEHVHIHNIISARHNAK